VALLLAGLLLSLSGCQAQPVATVNGTPITGAELDQALLYDHGARVLVEMIDELVITQAARAARATATDEQIAMRRESLLAQAGGQAMLDKMLAAQHLSPAQFLARVRLGVLLDDVVLRGLTISDAQIQEYYRAHLADYRHGAQVHARLIMSASEENAQALKQALDAGGDFAGLARTLSTDPATAPQGGDMGWFERKDYAPAISDMAFSLKPGQVSRVFAGPDGYCLLKVEDTRPGAPRPLAEMREEIVTTLKFAQLLPVRQQWLVAHRRQVRLGLTDPVLLTAIQVQMQQAPPPGTPAF
jgi:parvulin-like peptidyl-prolyl isomerase